MKIKIIILVLLSTPLLQCKNGEQNLPKESLSFALNNPQAISLIGEELSSPEPSKELFKRWKEKYNKYLSNSTDIDNIIWHGRFTAYMGDYKKAISIFTKGISIHPNDARLYRHRGHRLITIRKFQSAISDFTKAAKLINGRENEVEPDGMPNPQNIPVSTLHGNIYYHLGLAHYLNGDLPNSLEAYTSCLATSERPDNVVSASHWLYMINRRLGNEEAAKNVVMGIAKDMDIIENMSYHKLCLLYNESMDKSEVLPDESSSSANDAILYGIANWHIYNSRKDKGVILLENIIKNGNWASFGYLAAESDLSRIRNINK